MNDRSSVFITPRYFVFAPDEGEVTSPSDEDETVTYSETIDSQELLDQVTLTNHLLVGIILFIGIFFGAFCMSHLYNRIRRD